MLKTIETASVFGLGKLGACIAATLALRGLEVVGIDIDAAKVKLVNDGLPPVDEPRLGETIQAAGGRLRASTDPREAIRTDASFFIPPTPSLPDGSFSNEFLLRAMQSCAGVMRAGGKKGHLFVCSSTTTPGACDSVLIPMIEKEIGGSCGPDFGFLYNPEFIALGNVVSGLLDPELVLIGESDPESGAALEAWYRRYTRTHPPISRMSIISAELAKISLNSFITMKISFTNQLRLIAEKLPRADIHAVLDAIGSDSRVGKKYLRAGLSYGGPCFPRDNRLVAYTAEQVGLSAPLAEASDRINEQTKLNLVEKVKAQVRRNETVAVLGLSYKPDTYITEESAGLYLAQQLKRQGYRVVVHDFAARPANSPNLHEFEVIEDVGRLASRSDLKLVVICCPWPGYKELALPAGARLLAAWKF